jgi:hypothetical protein
MKEITGHGLLLGERVRSQPPTGLSRTGDENAYTARQNINLCFP